jgi:hypothetical protein
LPKELAYSLDWNNTQSYTKKDNQANKLLKQVGTTIGSTVHSELDRVFLFGILDCAFSKNIFKKVG